MAGSLNHVAGMAREGAEWLQDFLARMLVGTTGSVVVFKGDDTWPYADGPERASMGKRYRIYWREQGGSKRAYGDFRDVGGKREGLIPPGETRATTDPVLAECSSRTDSGSWRARAVP